MVRIEKQLENMVKRLETLEAQMKALKPSGPEPAPKTPQRPPTIAYNPRANYDDDPRFVEIARQEAEETNRAKTKGNKGKRNE